MRFGILGPLTVEDGDQAVEIRRGLPRTLLIALLLRANETVAASALKGYVTDPREYVNTPIETGMAGVV